MSLLIAAALLTSPKAVDCPLPFPVVRDEAAARAVAAVVIASAPARTLPRYILRYDLRVHYVSERRSWLVTETPVARAGDGMLGGGGFGMEIAACDGAVSDIHVQI